MLSATGGPGEKREAAGVQAVLACGRLGAVREIGCPPGLQCGRSVGRGSASAAFRQRLAQRSCNPGETIGGAHLKRGEPFVHGIDPIAVHVDASSCNADGGNQHGTDSRDRRGRCRRALHSEGEPEDRLGKLGANTCDLKAIDGVWQVGLGHGPNPASMGVGLPAVTSGSRPGRSANQAVSFGKATTTPAIRSRTRMLWTIALLTTAST